MENETERAAMFLLRRNAVQEVLNRRSYMHHIDMLLPLFNKDTNDATEYALKLQSAGSLGKV